MKFSGKKATRVIILLFFISTSFFWEIIKIFNPDLISGPLQFLASALFTIFTIGITKDIYVFDNYFNNHETKRNTLETILHFCTYLVAMFIFYYVASLFDTFGENNKQKRAELIKTNRENAIKQIDGMDNMPLLVRLYVLPIFIAIIWIFLSCFHLVTPYFDVWIGHAASILVSSLSLFIVCLNADEKQASESKEFAKTVNKSMLNCSSNIDNTTKKSLGAAPAVFPMPVLMVAAYDENDKVNVMNATGGMISAMDQITLFIGKDQKTTKNIKETCAFTVSIADVDNMDAVDFSGIETGNKMEDIFERTGYTTVKSDFVNAPIIEEFPVVMECELQEEIDTDLFYAIIGTIKNISADKSVLDENGKVDPAKVKILIFDQFQSGYYMVGEKVDQARSADAALMKKQ